MYGCMGEGKRECMGVWVRGRERVYECMGEGKRECIGVWVRGRESV